MPDREGGGGIGSLQVAEESQNKKGTLPGANQNFVAQIAIRRYER